MDSTTNNFGGVIINPAVLPDDVATFEQQLSHSLAEWSKQDLKLVWLEVPIQKAQLIPAAVAKGFIFHHSTDAYLMLTDRLQPDAFIPPYATHYIGVGGVVINEQNELLVVCEKYHRISRPRYYKLPGGALQQGEHLVDAAIREVFEETGVQTRFESMVCFRHWHGYRYGKSDIYFVCRLAPLSHAITPHEEEIEECLWMPLDEYLNHESVGHFNKQIVRAAISSRGVGPTWVDGYDDPTKREFFMPFELHNR